MRPSHTIASPITHGLSADNFFQCRNAAALREVISDLERTSCVTLYRLPRRPGEMFVILHN